MSRWMTISGLVTALALAAACGDPSPGDDAADPDAGNQDTTPPAIVSSTPVDGERPVSLLADITVMFDEDLDATTVSPDTLVLRVEGELWTIAGTVGFDAGTRTATFSPIAALKNYGTYTLTVDGVADVAGNPMVATTITFGTYRNPQVRSAFYSDFGAGVTMGGWTAYEIDGDGDRVESLRYGLAGLDDVWFTSDDEIDHRERYQYDAAKRLTLQVSYDYPGDDGVWGNGDDVVTSFIATTYNSAGLRVRQATYADAGLDLLWFTSDDVVGQYAQEQHDSTGHVVQRTRYNGAGDDGLWFTSDDTPYSNQINVWDDLGRQILVARFDGSGTDGVWFTADDQLSSTAGGHRFEDGQTDQRAPYYVSYSGAGSDANWGTSDDVIAGYSEFQYDAGIFVRGIAFDDPGIDQTWFTDDDHQSMNSEFRDFAAKDLAARYIDFADPGTDGEWFTSDDTVVDHRSQTFDSNGNVVEEAWFFGAGLDDVWLTEDDDRSQWALFGAPS